jgi:cob(I)alamin adenosyltransferase
VQQGQDLQIMTDKSKDKYSEEIVKELNNICEECKKEDESVSQNLILTSYKLCSSCRVSKTIFPI